MRERPTAGHVVLATIGPPDAGALVAAGARSDVGLHADDRLDPGGLAFLPELIGAEHVAVVGHGKGGHPHTGGLAEEVVDARRAVEHGVLGVHMKMCKSAWAIRSAIARRLTHGSDDPPSGASRTRHGGRRACRRSGWTCSNTRH